jgi:hypothetical protein
MSPPRGGGGTPIADQFPRRPQRLDAAAQRQAEYLDSHARRRQEQAASRQRIVDTLCNPTGTQTAAQRRARQTRSSGLFEADTSPFAYDPCAGPMSSFFSALPAVIDAGIPPNTLNRDDLAWRRWTMFCALVPTQAWRLDRNAHSGADPAGFDRESRLLCAFLVWCYLDEIKPRSKSSKAAKPASSWKMVDGVRSVHRRAGIYMVSTRQLTSVMKGLTAAHIKEHGSESLLPDRKDPIGPDLCRQLLATDLTALVGTKLSTERRRWDDPLFLSLGAMMALSESTGFRKSEVALPNGEEFDDRRLRRSSLLWEIDGRIFVDPSPAQLRSMVPGRDKAVIKPPRSKADQDGTIWGAHPIWIVLDETDTANAAARLQSMEIKFPCNGPQRAKTPLFFSDAKFSPLRHSTVDCYLEHLLRANVPAERVKAYSFHSFRVGFACALLAAHCPYDMIQALARWRSDKSVAIYARLNPNDYAGWVTKALQQKTTSRTAARLPVVIDDHDNVATYQLACTHAQRRAAAADED